MNNNCYKICFTGHRPKGLPWGYDEEKESCKEFKRVMYGILEKAIQNNYTYFISGMALGIDMICAEIVLNLKKKYKEVFLECAIPCLNQEKLWSENQQDRYNRILKQADLVHYVSKNTYTNDCMNNRNNYMVTKSDVVIAIWNGKPSGTANTIQMANNQGKKVRVVDLNNPK